MGSALVTVGCPHRLRSPIGASTAKPCPACAPYGPPGWPRRAWAITVDMPRRPRLADVAVAKRSRALEARWRPAGPFATRPPHSPMVRLMRDMVAWADEAAQVYVKAARDLSASIERAVAEGKIRLPAIEMTPLRIDQAPSTTLSRARNEVRYVMSQQARVIDPAALARIHRTMER